MSNQLRWALVALVVGALAAGGFGVAVALRGDGDEAETLHIEAGVTPDEGSEPFWEPPEVEEPPVPRLLQETPFVGITLADTDEGVEIKGVIPGSPAKEAGLKKGDLIRAVDGEKVESAGELVDRVRDAEPGDELTFTIERDGKQRDIDVRLAERPLFEGPPGHEMIPPGQLRERLREFDWDDLWPPDLLDEAWWLAPGWELLEEALTRFLDAQVRFLDEDGEVVTLRAVAGTIKAVGTDTLTVALNSGGEQKFAISEDTHVRKDIQRGELGDLKANDRVLVIVVGEGNEAAAVLAFSPPEES